MKKLVILAMVFAVALTGCNKSKDVTPTIKKGTPVETKFSVSGVEFTEGPQMKVTLEPTLVALQVFEIDSDNPETQTVVAGGLFKSNDVMNAVSVTLKHGVDYRIVGTAVKHGTGVFTVGEGDLTQYGKPFTVGTGNGVATAATLDPVDFTAAKKVFANLAAQADGDEDPTEGLITGERWYFDQTITADYNKQAQGYVEGAIKIDFKRVCFKVAYNVTNLRGNTFRANLMAGSVQAPTNTWTTYSENAVVVYTCSDIEGAYQDRETLQTITANYSTWISGELIKSQVSMASVKPNHIYTMSWNASLNAPNEFSITLEDTWQEEVY